MHDCYKIIIDSPIGHLCISATSSEITSLEFTEFECATPSYIPPVLHQCVTELNEYFDGKRKHFTVSLNPQGTNFQKEVWNELLKVPFGKTCSYMHIALQLNNLGAVRAVGSANGKNRIAIIIPCHRIIGENGKLTGYAGGLNRKRWLLEHELKLSDANSNLLF